MKTSKEVNLGDEVIDLVTGFKGIAIGRSVFLNGCVRVGIQAKADKDGKVTDAIWFDEPQLKVTKRGAVKICPQDTGGPIPSTPTHHSNPRR